jgi:hypothetical protein
VKAATARERKNKESAKSGNTGGGAKVERESIRKDIFCGSRFSVRLRFDRAALSVCLSVCLSVMLALKGMVDRSGANYHAGVEKAAAERAER